MRWVVIAAITAVALFTWSLSRVSTDALAMPTRQAQIDEPPSHLAYLDAPIGEVR